MTRGLQITGWCVLLISVAWWLPSTAAADTHPYRLALLELGIDQVDDALARSLTDSMRKLLSTRSEYQLRDTRVSLEQLSLAQDCDAAQPACLDKIATGLDIDGLVFGRLTNDRGGLLVRFHRYDVASHAVKSTALATLAVNDRTAVAVDRKAQELVNDLFQLAAARSPFARGQLKPHGSLDSSNAQLNPSPSVEKSTISVRQLTGFALLGGAVLSAGLSVVSFVEIDRAESNDVFQRYRRSVGQSRPSTRDVCDEAAAGQSYGLDPRGLKTVQNSCGTGRTFEVLQFLFIGSAVLSSGLSAYLLLGSQSTEARPLLGKGNFSLHPTVQRNGAALGARFKF